MHYGKKIKKLKLGELQTEHFISKELREVKGGVCACVSACLSESVLECYTDGYVTATNRWG